MGKQVQGALPWETPELSLPFQAAQHMSTLTGSLHFSTGNTLAIVPLRNVFVTGKAIFLE